MFHFVNKQFLFLLLTDFWVASKATVHLPVPLADLNPPPIVMRQGGFHPVGFFHLPPSHMDTALTGLERTISYPLMHCWSWRSNTLATWCEELTHWKRPWCWERLKVEGEGDNRGWDGWMASPTRWTWVWVSSGSWWWTGRPGVLQSMGSQRVGHDWVTELNSRVPMPRKAQAQSQSMCHALLVSWGMQNLARPFPTTLTPGNLPCRIPILDSHPLLSSSSSPVTFPTMSCPAPASLQDEVRAFLPVFHSTLADFFLGLSIISLTQ